jgi:hypothetical protein
MLVAEFGADVPIIVAGLDGTVLTTVVPATLLGAS